ncbi:MAG: tetratricopeptide repeat protein [Candidatus Krumholzibacteriales bacterium]
MGNTSDNDNQNNVEMTFEERRFSAQALYAESIFQYSVGDIDAAIHSLEYALNIDSEYAPAIMTMGSIEYQRQNFVRGKKLFLSLLSLLPRAADGGEVELADIIEEAGDFLIQSGYYLDGLELFRAALDRFPNRATCYLGISCCASHEGFLDEALEAAEKAYKLDPENQKCVNDFGWSLFEVGRLDEAGKMLSRSVEMDPSDELARENLRLCKEAIDKRGR